MDNHFKDDRKNDKWYQKQEYNTSKDRTRNKSNISINGNIIYPSNINYTDKLIQNINKEDTGIWYNTGYNNMCNKVNNIPNNMYTKYNIHPQVCGLNINPLRVHRINPSCNSLRKNILDIKRPIKKKSVIRFNCSMLYKYNILNITKTFNTIFTNDLSFYKSLNEFNDYIGIQKIPFKYCNVISFLYKEYKKYNGYFSTPSCMKKQYNHILKNMIVFNKIYLFYVYPFEQYIHGKLQVKRYRNNKEEKILEQDFKKENSKTIDICLCKGSINDIERLLYGMKGALLDIDSITILIHFFCDLYHLRIINISDVNCNGNLKSNGNKNYYPDTNLEIQIGNKKQVHGKQLNEELRKQFILKISQIEIKKIIGIMVRCINIIVSYGISCKKKYYGFLIDQALLDKVLNILIILAKINQIRDDVINRFLINCSCTSFTGTKYMYKYLYNMSVQDPAQTLRILSNMTFSKRSHKRLLRRMRIFIDPVLNNIINNIRYKRLVGDNRLLEYIVLSFTNIKSLRKDFLLLIEYLIDYYDYLYTIRKFYRVKDSSNFLSILYRMMMVEVYRTRLLKDTRLMIIVRKIPGLRELVY